MTRIAATTDRRVEVGRTLPGRGAWFCSVECFDRASEGRALERALRQEVSSADREAVRARLVRPN
jgi:predicted RNA-binding protein YlxR (DUF448 family)